MQEYYSPGKKVSGKGTFVEIEGGAMYYNRISRYFGDSDCPDFVPPVTPGRFLLQTARFQIQKPAGGGAASAPATASRPVAARPAQPEVQSLASQNRWLNFSI